MLLLLKLYHFFTIDIFVSIRRFWVLCSIKLFGHCVQRKTGIRMWRKGMYFYLGTSPPTKALSHFTVVSNQHGVCALPALQQAVERKCSFIAQTGSKRLCCNLHFRWENAMCWAKFICTQTPLQLMGFPRGWRWFLEARLKWKKTSLKGAEIWLKWNTEPFIPGSGAGFTFSAYLLAWKAFYSIGYPYPYLCWIINYALVSICFQTVWLSLPPARCLHLTLAYVSIR